MTYNDPTIVHGGECCVYGVEVVFTNLNSLHFPNLCIEMFLVIDESQTGIQSWI